MEQKLVLRKPKKLGKRITYASLKSRERLELSLLVFDDASKASDHCQIGVRCGILAGQLAVGALYHVLSWVSHKSKRPTKSILGEEILAAGEGIDEGKVIMLCFNELLDKKICFRVPVDSNDLFTPYLRGRIRSIRVFVAISALFATSSTCIWSKTFVDTWKS